jgi:alanyl-tRNA synthetase
MTASERLYYGDSFHRTFSARVTDVRELDRSGDQPTWQLALDRTAFYPTSGGQPFDTGLLRATSPGGAAIEIPVDSVEEDDAGEVWHFVPKPLTAGTHVNGEIDWSRRLDHMQQHTGQHLLSAVLQRELQAPTISFHLGDTVSTIDLAVPAIAPHSLERVERLANEIVAEDRPVTSRLVSRAEADAMLATGELRKLPERDGDIRLIEISDCDRNACGGTHVRSTGQIGGLLLRGTEKVSRGLRLEFVCGLRAVRTARSDAEILRKAAAALTIGVPDIPATVERLRQEVKSGAKERLHLREELAAYHASRLAVESPIRDGLRLVERTWKDRDRDYIRLLASRLAAVAPSTAAILCAHDAEPVRVVLARSLDLNLDCGRLMKEALAERGLRGGGSPDLAQGDIPAAQSADFCTSLARAIRSGFEASR